MRYSKFIYVATTMANENASIDHHYRDNFENWEIVQGYSYIKKLKWIKNNIININNSIKYSIASVKWD